MEEIMNTEKVIEELSDVIELDYDAIAAYKAAIERLEDVSFKTQLTEFMGDHERHVTELSDIVRSEGGTPPDEGDFKKMLTKGRVIIADMSGDEAILKAMKSNEDDTNKLYEKMVEAGFPESIHRALQNGLADERRHRAWLESIIERLD